MFRTPVGLPAVLAAAAVTLLSACVGRPHPTHQVTVQGVVVDDTGAPVNGAFVEFRVAQDHRHNTAVTGPDGVFRFTYEEPSCLSGTPPRDTEGRASAPCTGVRSDQSSVWVLLSQARARGEESPEVKLRFRRRSADLDLGRVELPLVPPSVEWEGATARLDWPTPVAAPDRDSGHLFVFRGLTGTLLHVEPWQAASTMDARPMEDQRGTVRVHSEGLRSTDGDLVHMEGNSVPVPFSATAGPAPSRAHAQCVIAAWQYCHILDGDLTRREMSGTEAVVDLGARRLVDLVVVHGVGPWLTLQYSQDGITFVDASSVPLGEVAVVPTTIRARYFRALVQGGRLAEVSLWFDPAAAEEGQHQR